MGFALVQQMDCKRFLFLVAREVSPSAPPGWRPPPPSRRLATFASACLACISPGIEEKTNSAAMGAGRSLTERSTWSDQVTNNLIEAKLETESARLAGLSARRRGQEKCRQTV